MESDDSLCRAISSTHDDSPSLEVKGIRIGNRTLMPLKPGANGEYRDVTTGVGVCSTYGTSIEGNTFYPGLTQTSNSGSEPDFFWTDGTEVASQFNVPHNTKGVLCSSQGRYEFQLWTLQFKPVGIMRVTNSESKEQTELVQNALLKIGDTEQRKQLIQALESQTVTRPQKAILEVKYKDDMVHNV
ncbi:uncharacterized protein FIESC28_11408 [Fusarium coffeatum]|uniref:Uncharacterized protein n=1 Tax=Fusarium coffeatum TaxID=231269 RepID=A0A366QLR8_9HYPO|nr:uncharacterized protein FIESC28_11408 [Fusarium coffeatum]RBR05198.1 hypothetical protein FIESC28_11408 [Fusarium coffeatum]